MTKGGRTAAILLGVLLTAAIATGACYAWVPGFRAEINRQRHAVQKADDTTSYKTRKLVEDTARAMIASYEADALTYEQYQGSDNEEKQGWAEQARMRANRTASSYNSYLLENRYVWAGNIPADIRGELAPLTD